MNDILLERLLTNNFTFGFELEGFTFDYDKLEEKLHETFGYDGVLKDDCSLRANYADNKFNEKGKLESGKIIVYKNPDINDGDWIITDNNLENEFWESRDYHLVSQEENITAFLKEKGLTPVFVRAFEYASPVLEFIPTNIKKIWDFFKENQGKDKLIFTNDSCGFHHHISWKGISGEDAAWVLSQIAYDKDAMELLSKMKHSEDDGREYDFDFVTEYSALDDLEYVRDGIENFDFNMIAKHLNTDKFSILNNHSQKTLEWRGPRDFLDTESMTDIKNFYSQLWKVITMISKELDKKEINGMSKANYLKGLAETDYAGANQPLGNYPAFQLTADHLLDDKTLNLIVNKILTKDKNILISLTRDKRVCDQVIQKLFNKSELRKVIEGLGDNIPQIIYDLAYKYIPAVMAYKASEDALYRTSEKTLKRLVSTRYGIDISKLPEIIEYIVPKINTQLFATKGFNHTLRWDIIIKTNFKLAKYFIPFESNNEIIEIFGDMNEQVRNKEMVLEYYEAMPEALKEMQEIKSEIVKLVYQYPNALKYIDEITPYMIISLLGRGMHNGDEDSVTNALLNSGKVTPKDIESAKAYFTRYYKHSFNDEI